MEVTQKSCRWCGKTFYPKLKQQRYCGDICAYKGRKKATFRAYLEGKENQTRQSPHELDWARENDLSGLHLGKERYIE